MKWWKRALLLTVLLFVLLAGLAIFLQKEIREHPAIGQTEETRSDQIGSICGQIGGFGTGMIWFLAFTFRKRN